MDQFKILELVEKCSYFVTFKSGELVLIYLQDTGEKNKCTNEKGKGNESEVTETKQVWNSLKTEWDHTRRRSLALM